jgi:hypothetical protein
MHCTILNRMRRSLAILLLALLLPSPASGTLVVLVPSADGLVVAADSRTTVFGATCDSQYKITELTSPKRTVFVVTGDMAFIKPPNAGVHDVCGYLQSASRLLDIPAVVKHYLERKSSDPFKLSLDDLGADCVQAVQRFRESSPLVIEPYIGREIFSVVIASYDPRSKTSLVMNFVVRIDAKTHRVEAGRFTRIAIPPQNRRGVWSYGETDYLNQNVFGGVGRKYLTGSTLDFILADQTVAKVRLAQAVSTAANVIEAAGLTTQLVPSPSGIGGPIDIVLLSQKRQPRQIQWKGNQ